MLKNFRTILTGIDVEPLLVQLQENPQFWNVDDSWTKNKHGSPIYDTDNIVLRFTSGEEWNRPAFQVLTTAIPIVFDVMRALCGEVLGRVVITRLPPNGEIKPHIDHMPPNVTSYYQRYQIPLLVNNKTIFHCGNEQLAMIAGDAYWFDNQITHSVTNDGPTERLSMICDIRPFN